MSAVDALEALAAPAMAIFHKFRKSLASHGTAEQLKALSLCAYNA
jgi:hypothetical protein